MGFISFELGSDNMLIRLSQYEKRKSLSLFMGTGLGGLALFGDLAKDSFAEAPHELRAWFITLVVASGAAIGLSYHRFHYAAWYLDAVKHFRTVDETTVVPTNKEFEYPVLAWLLQWVGVVGLIVSAVLLCDTAWTSVSVATHSAPAELSHPADRH
jgi:Trk-type K+ transport system membrane component